MSVNSAIAVRATIYLLFWLMISGFGLKDLPVGLVATAAATWASFKLSPPGAGNPRPREILHLAWRFLRQSIAAGTDVARIALSPRMTLRPGFVAYPLHLPEGATRNAFCALSSLMPGTLPTGLDENGALLVHCLDVSQPVAENLAHEERLFMQAIGHE